MAEVGTYYITIMPEMSSFTGEVSKALKGTGKSGGKAYGTSFVDIVKGSAIGTALGGLAQKAGGAIASGFSTGVGRLDTIKNYPKVMESLGYTTEDADRSIQTIMGHLDGLPTATQDMVTLTQSISDSTGDLDLATAAALGFNDMMLANGASAAEVATAQGVLNRVLGKGSATAAQWQSLTSVMPAQLGMVAKSMLGAEASTEDLHTALEDGTVSWQDFLQAIADLDKNGYIDESGKKLASFEEQARANSHGIGTAIDNIRNRIGAGWAQILDKVGQEEISGTIDKMSYGVKNAMYRVADAVGYIKDRIGETKIGENLKKIFDGISTAISNIDTDELKGIADTLIGMVDGALQWIADNGELVSTLLAGIGGALFSIGTFTAMIDLATMLGLLEGTPGILATVWAALSANPFMVIVAAIGAVVTALGYFFTQTETGKAIVKGFCDFCKRLWSGLTSDFTKMVDQIKQNLEDNKVQWEVFKGNVKAVVDSIIGFFLNLKTDFDNTMAAIRQRLDDTSLVWDNFKQKVATAVENLRTTVVEKVEAIKTKVHDIAEGIRTTVHDKFTDAKDTVLGIFDGIREGIREKLDAAWQTVRDIVDSIKGLFDFSWSLPAPQLPHITWDWLDVGGIVSIPTFGIDWYARGGVFDSAAVIGIGEGGREAALPLNARTYGEIARGIAGELGAGVTVSGNTFVIREEADIDRIADALDRKIRRERMAMA